MPPSHERNLSVETHFSQTIRSLSWGSEAVIGIVFASRITNANTVSNRSGFKYEEQDRRNLLHLLGRRDLLVRSSFCAISSAVFSGAMAPQIRISFRIYSQTTVRVVSRYHNLRMLPCAATLSFCRVGAAGGAASFH